MTCYCFSRPYQINFLFYLSMKSNRLLAMCSDQDVPESNQSLRILSNLVAAGAFSSSGLIDELIKELLVFTESVIAMKSSEVTDMMAKVHHKHLMYLFVCLFLSEL